MATRNSVYHGKRLHAQGSGLYTGPRHEIGSGHEYHIDINVLDPTDIDKAVAILDTYAAKLAEKNLEIEFSNADNDGQRKTEGKKWDPNADPQTKAEFAKAVMAAHDHGKSKSSMDFYIVPKGENRFSDSVTTYREMPLVLAPGWKAEYDTGPRYGNFVTVYDENGKAMYMMGHGATSKQRPQDFTAAGSPKSGNPAIATRPTPSATNPYGLPESDTVKRSVNQSGLEHTYDTFSGFAPQGQGGEIFLQLLFAMIMMVAGMGHATPPPEEQTQESRRETLQKIDKSRGITTPSPALTNDMALHDGTSHSDPDIPSLTDKVTLSENQSTTITPPLRTPPLAQDPGLPRIG